MARYAVLVVVPALILFWIVAFSPVLVSSALIASIVVAWCRAVDHPA
jgi:hypothetical protein